MPLPRAALRLCRLGTALPLMGAGLAAWHPVQAQGVASGAMAVRVTVLEPVQPMSLARATRAPRLERDPVSGAPILQVGLTTDARVVAQVGDDGAPTAAALVRDEARPGTEPVQRWRVTLPADGQWAGDTLEVRFTTHTGEAETIAIARVSRTALQAMVAAAPATNFRRSEPGLF